MNDRFKFAGFEDDNNSAKVLLDVLPTAENITKIYLKNNFLFIHVPSLKNLKDIDKLAEVFYNVFTQNV